MDSASDRRLLRIGELRSGRGADPPHAGLPHLGPSTPVGELARTAATSHADLVVLAATVPQTLEQLRPDLTSLARRVPLALAGASATPELARAVGARLMAGDR
jgi:methanogenic corrinoid protein MtbC1